MMQQVTIDHNSVCSLHLACGHSFSLDLARTQMLLLGMRGSHDGSCIRKPSEVGST